MNYVQTVYDSHSNSADNKKNHPGKGVERSGKEPVRACFLAWDEETWIRRKIKN